LGRKLATRRTMERCTLSVQDFAESYNLNEEDENRIVVLNRDTGEVSVWELTIQKEYDITEVVA